MENRKRSISIETSPGDFSTQRRFAMASLYRSSFSAGINLHKPVSVHEIVKAQADQEQRIDRLHAGAIFIQETKLPMSGPALTMLPCCATRSNLCSPHLGAAETLLIRSSLVLDRFGFTIFSNEAMRSHEVRPRAVRQLGELRGGEQAGVRGVVQQQQPLAALVAARAPAAPAARLQREATHCADGVDERQHEESAE